MDLNTIAMLVIDVAKSATMDINAAAAVVTAAATSATGYFAWRAWRQQQADRQPVVELRHDWLGDGSLSLWVTIRNRLGESMVVEEAHVLRPRRALLTRDRARDETGGESGFAPAKERRIRLDWNVAPFGTPTATVGRGSFAGTSANERIQMNAQFPGGWRGGQLKLALRIASVSLDEQRRWIKIKRRIPAPTADQRRPQARRAMEPKSAERLGDAHAEEPAD
jgi:hypothetical protein